MATRIRAGRERDFASHSEQVPPVILRFTYFLGYLNAVIAAESVYIFFLSLFFILFLGTGLLVFRILVKDALGICYFNANHIYVLMEMLISVAV